MNDNDNMDSEVREEDSGKRETEDNHSEESEASTEKDIDPVELVREEAKLNYDRYLRVAADFENYKKRASKELEEFRKYANEALIKALLPAIDNLERAVKSVREDGCDLQALVQGVELTLTDIVKVLNQFQVQQISAMGENFDPNVHQAMMQEASDEHPDNTVIQELQKGYTIHNRLLRPAMVVISKTTDK